MKTLFIILSIIVLGAVIFASYLLGDYIYGCTGYIVLNTLVGFILIGLTFTIGSMFVDLVKNRP